MEAITLSDESIQKLGDVIAAKILYAKNLREKPVSIEGLAEIIGYSIHAIYRWTSKADIPRLKRDGKLMFYPSEVQEWLKKR